MAKWRSRFSTPFPKLIVAPKFLRCHLRHRPPGHCGMRWFLSGPFVRWDGHYVKMPCKIHDISCQLRQWWSRIIDRIILGMDSTCLSSLPHDLPCRMSSKSCRDLQVDRSTSWQRFQLQIVGSLRRYLQQKGEACPAIQTFSVKCWENVSARWEQHQARV